MNVAIVNESINAARGGAETSTLEMAEALTRQGHHVTILFADRQRSNPRDPSSSVAESVDMQPVPISNRRSSKAASARAFVEEVDARIAVASFDVVHAVSPCLRADVYQPRGGTYPTTIRRTLARQSNPAIRALKAMGRRLNRRQRTLLGVERALLTRAPLPPVVACGSAYIRAELLFDFPDFPHDRARVVFNAVQPQEPSHDAREQLRAWYDVRKDQHVLLFVAHNFQLKGLRELLHAVVRLNDRAWTLWVVGSGRTASFERLARKLSIRDRVRFLGPMSPTHPTYHAADLLVHPTWYDPCSRVVLEAVTSGLPVVSTRWNGASEIITSDAIGRIVADPGDIDELAAAIESARALPRLDDALTSALRRSLSMDRHADELSVIYDEVVANR